MSYSAGERVFDWAFPLSIAAVFAGLLGLATWAIIGSVRSNGETDYCYVEMWSPGQMSPQYQLHAHRPWRLDIVLGNYPTLDEAAAKAEMLHCPLGKR